MNPEKWGMRKTFVVGLITTISLATIGICLDESGRKYDDPALVLVDRLTGKRIQSGKAGNYYWAVLEQATSPLSTGSVHITVAYHEVGNPFFIDETYPSDTFVGREKVTWYIMRRIKIYDDEMPYFDTDRDVAFRLYDLFCEGYRLCKIMGEK